MPAGPPGAESGYAEYLRAHGNAGSNPWTDQLVGADGPGGTTASGWFLRNVHLPARVAEEHSETAYVTHRAWNLLAEQGGEPWA